MAAHRYINVATEFLSDHGSPARTERIRERLQAERAFHRSAEAGSYDATVAAKNIANLEQALERAEANQAARAARRQELQQAEASKTVARQEQEQAALEARLRAEYDRTLPKPTTDQEWQAVRESVLHRHALREMDRTEQLVADTARRYKF